MGEEFDNDGLWVGNYTLSEIWDSHTITFGLQNIDFF